MCTQNSKGTLTSSELYYPFWIVSKRWAHFQIIFGLITHLPSEKFPAISRRSMLTTRRSNVTRQSQSACAACVANSSVMGIIFPLKNLPCETLELCYLLGILSAGHHQRRCLKQIRNIVVFKGSAPKQHFNWPASAKRNSGAASCSKLVRQNHASCMP